jgi:hypothetical protein
MEEEILPHGDNAFGSNDPRPWSANDSRFDAALPNVDRLVLDASEHASRAEQPTATRESMLAALPDATAWGRAADGRSDHS